VQGRGEGQEKVKWLTRRKYVNGCIAVALKGHPTVDVNQLLKDHPDLADLPAEKWDAF
jgi:hypothetical protein